MSVKKRLIIGITGATGAISGGHTAQRPPSRRRFRPGSGRGSRSWPPARPCA